MGKTTKKNTDIFKEEIFHLIQDEYNVVGEYINAKTKIKMIHNICQFEYEVTPSNFKKGRRCPKCRNKEISIRCRRTHEQFIKEIHNKVGLEYSVLSKYQTSQTSIEMKHNICGYKWDVSPNSFLRGSRCPKCANEFRKNKFMKKHETFMEELNEIMNEEYEVLSEYKGALTKINVRHIECGYQYKALPINLLRGHGCPKCNESKGERKISKLLEEYKIKHKSQQSFADCIYKRKLPFDLSVTKENNVIILIEYDGEQHFKQIKGWGGDKYFQQRQIKDRIKNKYCKSNNIPLVRIPYWEYNNIEFILEHVLGYFKLIDKQNINKSLVHKFLVNHHNWSHDQYIKQVN